MLLVTYQEEISMWLAKLVRDVSVVCGVGMSSLLLVGREEEGKRKGRGREEEGDWSVFVDKVHAI